MTNSGGYNNADNKALEEDVKDGDGENKAAVVTESGEISTGANSNDIFSDSAPGDENSAAKNSDADTGTSSGNNGKNDSAGK
jgi:hypothetical protein